MSSPDPFAPTQLFAFPVHSSLVNDHEQHREGLVRAIQEHRRRSPGIVKSNRDAWHSGDDFMALRNEHVQWVIDSVTLFARHALARYYNDWATQELRLGKFWANVVPPGGWNAPHHHVPSYWSGSYYVDVGTPGTTPGDLGGMIEFLNPNPIQAMWNRSGNFAVGPRNGMCLLFPSALVHLVHPHRMQQDRISIAYNFTVVQKG